MSRGDAQAPRVWLDHVYIVLDSNTYAAVAGSAVLPTLVAVQQRTTTSGTRTWSGSYLQGLHTYVELFPPGTNFGAPGRSGIAFSAETQGTAEALKTRLALVGATPNVQFITGLRAGKQEPWYYSLHVWTDTTLSLARWVMEYHPEFLTWEGTDSVLADGRAFRRRMPRRRYNASLPFLDVVGLAISMPPWDAERLRKELVAYGWAVEPARANASSFVATGPEIALSVNVGNSAAGISVMEFSLKGGPSTASEVSLGASILRMTTDRAVWQFPRK